MGYGDEYVVVDERGGGMLLGGFRSLMRRKPVDNSARVALHKPHHQHQQLLAKDLSILQLIGVGVGATIGAGVYVLVGTVAREHAGPALAFSFLIAGIAAALSAFCYAELASRCPSAGSAYHYTYYSDMILWNEVAKKSLRKFFNLIENVVQVEVPCNFIRFMSDSGLVAISSVAWLIGWALVLEYTIGGSTVARGISPNLALFFGGEDKLPGFLARAYVPWLDIVVDPSAAFLVLIVTGLLCLGIKESTTAQAIITSANVCVLIFVIVAGSYLGFQTGWIGYGLPTGYFPFGVNGVLAGSATVFFSYIGFDSVASTAEEVKNPQRDLPLGIGISLSACCFLYMLVAVVIVGLVPYYALDPDMPISSAFSSRGMQWAAYIIAAGAITALCASLMASILPQPRILMAMARDGLLPSFFSDVNSSTRVPVKSTIATGVFAAILALCMDVSQLAGMVSVGTLLAFTTVAVSILVLRYVPPGELSLPASLQDSINAGTAQYSNQGNVGEGSKYMVDSSQHGDAEFSAACPLLSKEKEQDKLKEQKRRRIAAVSISFVCIGVLLVTSAASAEHLLEDCRKAVM
ncbi:hypothetical protein ACLOJK_033927 [Asimina triloba]